MVSSEFSKSSSKIYTEEPWTCNVLVLTYQSDHILAINVPIWLYIAICITYRYRVSYILTWKFPRQLQKPRTIGENFVNADLLPMAIYFGKSLHASNNPRCQ